MSDWVPWRQRPENREYALRQSRERYHADKERILAQRKEFREQNKEYYSEQQRRYHQKHKESDNRRTYFRKRGLKRHVLSWQFKTAIEEFYKEARKRTDATGILHVVDHIWPINGKDSCGLHVPWNLRVITQRENDQKGNKRPSESGSSVLNMETYNGESD